MLSAATRFPHPPASPALRYPTPHYVVRRIKRLIWFALLACIALVSTVHSQHELPQLLATGLALGVILVASWAIVMQVTVYVRAEDGRRAAESDAARFEGARLTASAMQDRMANKLALTVGYAEFLVTDPRLPEDLRDHARKAIDGARAAAEQMSELRRLTGEEYESRMKRNGTGSPTASAHEPADRLLQLMAPLPGDQR